jgi:hypothetical protein
MAETGLHRLRLPMSHKNHSRGQNPNLAAASAQVNVLPYKKTEICRPPSQEEISRRAYFNYVNEGSKPGNDVYHWLEAEADLRAGCTLINADEAKP